MRLSRLCATTLLFAVCGVASAQPGAPLAPQQPQGFAPFPGPQSAVPGVPVTTPGTVVVQRPYTVFDFFGLPLGGRFLRNTDAGQAVVTRTRPIGRRLGLGPSLLAPEFAFETPGSAMQVANELKVEELKKPLKIKAIRFLGTKNCRCEEKVAPALLDALDDCDEEVRYEALLALQNKCGGDEKDKKKKKHMFFQLKKQHGCTDLACTTCDEHGGCGGDCACL
ncbi:MAG: HEAT repeat domain-containing protein, partial [Planctomycetia bacterium]